MTVFYVELKFCPGVSGIWRTAWGLIKQPQKLLTLPAHTIIGLALFFTGLTIMITGQVTLFKNYSGTLVIREDHQLITHGVYRFARHPMYMGLIVVVIGLPVYAASLYGFLISLLLIPIILIRIRLEEALLMEAFPDAYRIYKETTKKLIPFIY